MTTVRVLPLAAWPEDDRRRWQAACRPGRRIGGGRAGRWREVTRANRVALYGRWLGFLVETAPQSLAAPLAARVTEALLAAYVDAMVDLADQTVRTCLCGLHAMLVVLEPALDWSWLKRRINDTVGQHNPRTRREPTVTARELYWFGIDMMEAADGINGRHHRATAYRKGLVFALLAARPLRLRTFSLIRIGTHLVEDGGSLRMRFAGADTKTGRPLDIPYPVELRAHLDRYLTRHRPVLLHEGASDALWISDWGTPCSESTIAGDIRRLTTRHFPPGFGPHGFRHAAATLVALDRPEEMWIIREILGHATLEAGQRHYNRARGAQAAAAHQHALAARRRRR